MAQSGAANVYSWRNLSQLVLKVVIKFYPPPHQTLARFIVARIYVKLTKRKRGEGEKKF
jgi:hypothetical protein